MSEEILKALMQLFGLIAKQDEGVQESEILFVRTFLEQQLNSEDVEEYFALFEKYSVDKKRSSPQANDGKVQRTSMKDSVRILGICKKINRSLNKEQKVVALVRLYELIKADKKFTEQRIEIINTVADVFKLSETEKANIEEFVVTDDSEKLSFENALIINSDCQKTHICKQIHAHNLDGNIFILHVESSNLYFLKYTGKQEIFLNGLMLNNKRIYLFAKGSILKLPSGAPIYYTDVVGHFLTDKSTAKITYEAKNMGFTFKNGGDGLHDINIAEEQGRLVGIMGASGAGKTTLLNVLSGIEKPTTGSVEINGVNMHTKKEELEGVIGLIPQDDLLIEELTVFQNLYYSAKLCFKNKDEESLVSLVNDILRSLDLYERKDLKVGSPLNKMISGGQRKRLNIALELIREPAVLFVDEPTSGLSSRDSENVMNLLRELTLKGKLIFVVIHQPSSDIFKMFDKMIILDTGGYPVYYGNPSESLTYFKRLDSQVNSEQGECQTCGNLNPELIFNIIDANVIDEYGNYTNKRKVTPKEWNERYKKNITIPKIEEAKSAPPKSLNIPSWLKQFYIYTVRDFKSKISNKQYILLNLLEAPVLGFILAFLIRYIVDPESDIYIFRDNSNIPPYYFMGIIVALFLGLIISAEEIFKDAKILKRESFLNLSRSSYLASKVLILFTVSAIQMALFVAIANPILGIKGMYFEFWLALFTISAFANILGLILSSSFNSIVTIYILIPLVMIPQMILGGAMFTFDKLNRDISRPDKVPIVAEFMPSRWIYEGLMVNQFKNNTFQSQFYDIEQQISESDFKNVYLIPELREINYACFEYLNTNKPEAKAKQYAKDVALLKNELGKENNKHSELLFDKLDNISVETMNVDDYNDIDQYLDKLESYYTDKFNIATNNKDMMTSGFINKYGNDYFQSIKNTYTNDAVSDIVRKVFEKNKILRNNDELIQNIDPIYNIPTPSGVLKFRSHFFAPKKFFANKYHDTLWFNIAMVWFFTSFLYLVLYFNLLSRLNKLLGSIKLLKK